MFDFYLENTNLIIVDVFQGVADHTDAHVDQVRGGHLEHLLRELLTILVDLLHRKQNITTDFTTQYIVLTRVVLKFK